MIKTAVCYFSGSGNSFDIALELCKYIDVETVFYMPNMDMSRLEGFDEVIIVSPVYGLDIPKPVQDFIRNLRGEFRYFAVLNYAYTKGKASSTIKKMFNQNKLELACIKKVRMPSSYTIAFAQPDFVVKSVLKKAKRKVRRIANRIKSNEKRKLNISKYGKVNRYVGYSTFSNNLSVTAGCTDCMRCVNLCPVDNIHMYQGNVEFGGKCVGCMKCYNACDAIEYKHRKGKKYVNPNIDLKLMR